MRAEKSGEFKINCKNNILKIKNYQKIDKDRVRQDANKMFPSRLLYPRYLLKSNYRSSTQTQTMLNIHTNLINFMNL
jgi:hypothetical protein